MELVLLRMLSSDIADSRDDDVLPRLRVRLAGDAPLARRSSMGPSISSLHESVPGINDLIVDNYHTLQYKGVPSLAGCTCCFLSHDLQCALLLIGSIQSMWAGWCGVAQMSN